MRRLMIVLSLGITAQFGFTAAHASTDSTRPMIDQIFESTFPKEPAPPAPPAPAAPEAPRPVMGGIAGQSLMTAIPSIPELKLPQPAPVSAGLSASGAAGASTKGSSGESAEGEDGEVAEEETETEEAEEPRAERTTAADRAGARRVSSTAYCLTGTMASGRRVYSGAAAMNGTPLGSRYQVLDGPRAGETFVVEDRIGYGSAFDIAYPGDCRGANNYGRRTISIRPV